MTRKVGGRTHSSINQENKNLLRHDLEMFFFSQPISQGGIDLSNLLSVTMKLYFPLNRPTNVTDESFGRHAANGRNTKKGH